MTLSLHDKYELSKKKKPENYPEHVELDGICDGHDHFRDTLDDGDGRAEFTVPMAAAVEEVVLSMGNTKTVINTSARARVQQDKWKRLIPRGNPMRILVAGLLSPSVSPDDIVAGWDKPDGMEDWHAMKIFKFGVSNDEGNSVKFMRDVLPHIRAMTDVSRFKYKKRPMPLLVHAEDKREIVRKNGEIFFGEDIFILDRENYDVENEVWYVLKNVPGVSLTIEHISDHRTVENIYHWRKEGYNVYGGIAPHYTEYTLSDLFEGPSVNCHLACWPIFKTPKDREAVKEAMVSGKPVLLPRERPSVPRR
jgi:dihydroorotase